MTGGSVPLVTITILNYNSLHFLRPCLESIEKEAGDVPREIIVVDNGSHDGSLEYLRDRWPDVIVIANSINKGVGPARNQAMGIANGRYVLNLDSDIVILPGAIQSLIAEMDRHLEVGLSGARLLSAAGRLQDSCRRFPTAGSKIVRRLFPKHVAIKLLGDEEYLDWDHRGLRYVGYVIGACHMIRRTAMKQVGLYDERIFYGPEDVDYCLRLWKAGWRVLYNGNAEIIHVDQRMTARWTKLFARPTREHAKGLAVYFWKHRYFLRPPHPERALDLVSAP